MVYLVAGLVVFLGLHSLRIVADGWRAALVSQMGAGAFKGAYSVLSLVGFFLIIYGFGVARETPVVLWMPPVGMRHATSLLTLIAFVLLVAAYVPGNGIKARVHHPMVLGVKTWALAHLLANGQLVHLLLFGGFLLWAVADDASLRARDRQAGKTYAAGTLGRTVLTVVLGVLAWAVFAFKLHGWLIGIRPLAVLQ